jgi:GT2 family glycosyltransferase
MKVYVVLLNWNGWRDTLECLESLFKSNYENFSVIVCDNASTDNSVMEIARWIETELCSVAFALHTQDDIENNIGIDLSVRLTLISNSGNHGFAGGNNVGIRFALKDQRCGFIWLLNNDTVVHLRALEQLVAHAEKDDRIGICGSLLCFYADKNIVQAVGGVKFSRLLAHGEQIGQGLSTESSLIPFLGLSEPTYIAGASMLVRTGFIEDVGYMESKYFLYFEEMDWAQRGIRNWKMATAVNSIVYHKEGGSIGTSSLSIRSNLSQYYLNRNLILFYLKFHPFLLPIAIFRVAREAIVSVKNKNYAHFKTTCRALWDGLLQRDGARYKL